MSEGIRLGSATIEDFEKDITRAEAAIRQKEREIVELHKKINGFTAIIDRLLDEEKIKQEKEKCHSEPLGEEEATPLHQSAKAH
jgi:hypothetical protein